MTHPAPNSELTPELDGPCPPEAASRIAELEAKLATASIVLRECLGVFGAPNFTDRGGHADMIRQALASIQERT